MDSSIPGRQSENICRIFIKGMLDAVSDPDVKMPPLQRCPSMDPTSLLNLEWQQEICDDISSFGKEKYIRFMELVVKDRSLFGRAISFMEQRPIRTCLITTNAVLGTLSASLYIWSTYLNFSEDLSFQEPLECVIGVVLILTFVIRSMLDGMNYMWSRHCVADVITNWPSIITIVWIYPFPQNYLYSVSRMLRVLRLRYLVVATDKVSGAVSRQILAILTSMLALSVAAAAIFQYHEFYNNGRYSSFHDNVYLMVMNITTVGPGDVHVVQIVSRFMVLATVVISFSLLPLQVTHLVWLWPPDETREASTHLANHHVVVILPPEITADEITDFLDELFHSNHGNTVFPVVLLTSVRTNRTLMQTLKSHTFFRHITFLSGSAYEDRDLQRSNLSSARAAFVLSRRSCESLEQENDEDIHTLMAAASVKNYCPAIPTIVQINNPQNGASVLWRSLAGFPNIQLFCVKQVKMSLLAGSCVCPGLHVLVGNLLQSFVAHVDVADAWHKEYIWGATNALFPTVFGAYFQGKRFLEAAVELYTAIDVMPIAVFKRNAETKQIEILLGPFDYQISDGDLVYVLSRSLESASMVPCYPDLHRRASTVFASKLIKSPVLAASFQMLKQVNSCNVLTSGLEPIISQPQLKWDSIQGHIVICGYIDVSVIDLIHTLRKQVLSKSVPVAIIFETTPSAELHFLLSTFGNILIVTGGLQDPNTLSAANVTAANHILLLANPFAKAQGDVHDQVVKVDFDNIVMLLELENYLHSKTHRADTNVTVEILFLSNLRFIRPNFTYSVAALNELSSCFEGLRVPQLAAADGKIHASGMLQSVAAFLFYSPHILKIIDTLIYGSVGKDHRRIVLVEIPKRLFGETYAEMVKRLAAEYGVLAIALFRGRSAPHSPVPYVFTKPSPGTIVSADDRVYVLGSVSNHDQKPIIKRLDVGPNRCEDMEQSLRVVMSTYNQKRENLESTIHMFQQAMRVPNMRKSQLFEPDSPAWFMRIRSWWRSATREVDFSWRNGKRHWTHEPHDYREFMKERNQRLGPATHTSKEGREGDFSFIDREPFDYDDVHQIELSGINSAMFLSESGT